MNTGFLISARQTAAGAAALLVLACVLQAAPSAHAAEEAKPDVIAGESALTGGEAPGGVVPDGEVPVPVDETAPAESVPVSDPLSSPQGTPAEEAPILDIPQGTKAMPATTRSDTPVPFDSASATDITPPENEPQILESPDSVAVEEALTAPTVTGPLAEKMPSLLALAVSCLTGALAMFGLMRVTQKDTQVKKIDPSHRCRYCRGTGEVSNENKEAGACDECDGTGTVEEESEPATECLHCHGEGEDPCHDCEGAGKDGSGVECAACHGGGKTLEEKTEYGEEPEVADCEVCDGEGEVSATIKKSVACAKCGGTGRA
jgi:hypothetical protein